MKACLRDVGVPDALLGAEEASLSEGAAVACAAGGGGFGDGSGIAPRAVAREGDVCRRTR